MCFSPAAVEPPAEDPILLTAWRHDSTNSLDSVNINNWINMRFAEARDGLYGFWRGSVISL